MLAVAVHVLNAGLALGCGVLAVRIGLTLAPMVTMKGALATPVGALPRLERPGHGGRAPGGLGAPVSPQASTRTPWSVHAVIVERDLFHEPALLPAADDDPDGRERAVVQPTGLPLSLLGTISTDDTELGAAAIWNSELRRRLVVVEGDWVAGGRAIVVDIERRRVLLDEGGVVRELVFDEDAPKPPHRRASRLRRARRPRGRR